MMKSAEAAHQHSYSWYWQGRETPELQSLYVAGDREQHPGTPEERASERSPFGFFYAHRVRISSRWNVARAARARAMSTIARAPHMTASEVRSSENAPVTSPM